MAMNLTLTDLNSDCLLELFEYSDLETLPSLVHFPLFRLTNGFIASDRDGG